MINKLDDHLLNEVVIKLTRSYLNIVVNSNWYIWIIGKLSEADKKTQVRGMNMGYDH